MFITPDSLFIRLANINSWNLIFYRGLIPFLVVFIGLIFIYKTKLLKELINNSWHGVAYAAVFTMTNIVFVISIENTNVANTLIMIAMAPMLSAIISFIFLKENPDQKTWVAITITTLAVIYIFYDALDAGDFLGNFLGLVAAMGLAIGANIIRSAKKISLVPSAMIGKLMVALIALLFVDQIKLEGNDLIIVPLMCIMCVAIPFVLVTLAPRYITAAEVNLFFLLETILGPLWVWLVIREQPSIETIIGGGIIIATIAIHSTLALKKT
jgi:drug/metabolite transporter (DMT)-like permease